jgi:hypothetical protein
MFKGLHNGRLASAVTVQRFGPGGRGGGTKDLLARC